jgi:hypothetical protein
MELLNLMEFAIYRHGFVAGEGANSNRNCTPVPRSHRDAE